MVRIPYIYFPTWYSWVLRLRKQTSDIERNISLKISLLLIIPLQISLLFFAFTFLVLLLLLAALSSEDSPQYLSWLIYYRPFKSIVGNLRQPPSSPRPLFSRLPHHLLRVVSLRPFSSNVCVCIMRGSECRYLPILIVLSVWVWESEGICLFVSPFVWLLGLSVIWTIRQSVSGCFYLSVCLSSN